MAAEEGGVPVDLYIYDLTNGLASLLSPAIIGKNHTFNAIIPYKITFVSTSYLFNK